MEIRIRDLKSGHIYTNDMSDNNNHSILEMHFCTSYTQASVQDRIGSKYITRNVILPPMGSTPDPLDYIALADESHGEWVKPGGAQ